MYRSDEITYSESALPQAPRATPVVGEAQQVGLV